MLSPALPSPGTNRLCCRHQGRACPALDLGPLVVEWGWGGRVSRRMATVPAACRLAVAVKCSPQAGDVRTPGQGRGIYTHTR